LSVGFIQIVLNTIYKVSSNQSEKKAHKRHGERSEQRERSVRVSERDTSSSHSLGAIERNRTGLQRSIGSERTHATDNQKSCRRATLTLNNFIKYENYEVLS
jgi:hypothetical protein